MVERTVLLRKQDKKIDDSITLILTYYVALNQLYEILWTAHKHVLISPKLNSDLPSPPNVAFRNPKIIRDKYFSTKILKSGDKYESAITKKKYRINFQFGCNGCCLVYLLTCTVRLKQYVGSTVTRFRLRFNQYKSNIKLYGKGSRGLN